MIVTSLILGLFAVASPAAQADAVLNGGSGWCYWDGSQAVAGGSGWVDGEGSLTVTITRHDTGSSYSAKDREETRSGFLEVRLTTPRMRYQTRPRLTVEVYLFDSADGSWEQVRKSC